MPTLDAQIRRVPAQDIQGCIAVRMRLVAAFDTHETRLVLAVSGVDAAAFRAGLRRIGGIDLFERPAALGKFIGKLGFKAEPPLIKDGAVKSRLLPDVSPRLGNCTTRARGHIPDFQIFDHDKPETLGNAARCSMLPIVADTGHARGQPRNAAQLLRAALRSCLPARGYPLRAPLASFDSFETRRNRQKLAGRKSQRIGNASVNPYRRAAAGGRGMLDLTGKRNVPAIRLARYRHVFAGAAQGPRVAEFHPSDFRQSRHRPFCVEAACLHFPALKTETVVDLAAARLRIPRAARKEIAEGFVEVAQSLLLAGYGNGGNPVERGAKLRQLPRLCNVSQVRAGLPLIVAEPVAALLKSQIVNEAAHTGMLPETCFLLRRGIELVPEAAMAHAAKIAFGLWLPKMAENENIRMGRHVVYALHAHLVFVTKYRRDVLSELAIRDLRQGMPGFRGRAYRVQRRGRSRASDRGVSAQGRTVEACQFPKGGV